MAVSRTNLCTNPSFELGVTGWSVIGSGAITQTSACGVTQGSYAMQMDGTGSAVYTVACAAGLYVTIGVELTCAVATSASVSVVWLNSSGATISTGLISGVSFTGRTVATSAQSPSSTTSAQIIINSGTNGAWWLDAVTIETSTSAAGTSGSYFDGNSAPSTTGAVGTTYQWTGAKDASTSQQLTNTVPTRPQLANWPTIGVDTWPGSIGATGGAMPTSPATDLSGRTQQIKITRGRQYELDQDAAGECDLTVDNSDGAISPERGFHPITPVQVTATYQGTAHKLFTGFAERWPWQDQTTLRRTSSAKASDLLAASSSVQITSPTTELILAQHPNLYFPLTDAWSPVATLPNQGTAGTAYVCNVAQSTSIVGRTPGGLGRNPVVDGDPATGFEVDLTSSTPGHDGVYFSTAPVNMKSPWMVGCLFRVNQLDSGPVPILHLWDPTGTKILISLFLWSSHELSIQAWPSGLSPGDTTTQPTLNTFFSSIITETGACGLMVGWNGTNLFVDTTSPENATVGSDYYFALGSWSATPGWVSVGYPRTASAVYQGQSATWANQNIQVGHAMMFNHYDIASQNSNASWSLVTAWSEVGQHPYERLSDLAKMAGITASIAVDDGETPLGRYDLQDTTTVVDQIRQAGVTDSIGRVFIDGSGTLTYHDRWHYPAMSWNLGDGGLPYTGSPDWQYDPTYVYNDVQLSDTDIGNARSQDAASQARYMDRTLTQSPNLEYNSDLQCFADGLLARYKDPHIRIGKITLDPSANPALWPMVLQVELGHEVIVRHKTATGTRTFYGLVDQVTHTIDSSGSTWTTELQLSPEWPMWRPTIMHTTLAAAVKAGDTSITVNATPDASYNSPPASLGGAQGLKIDATGSSPETASIATVSAGSPGWTTATITLTTALAAAHGAGAVVRELVWTAAAGSMGTNMAYFDPVSLAGQSTIPTF